MKNNSGLFWGTLCLFVLVTAAYAQIKCGKHDQMVDALNYGYGEARKAYGSVNSSGESHLMETFVSGTGSFTILTTNAVGLSCIRLAGTNWEDVSWEPGQKT
jgi:hypothetical protein